MLTGQTILHYRILEKIGQGGMGQVYKADDLKLGRTVAIKVLPSEVTDDKSKRRLLQEARAASALNHPNIVTVYAIEEANGLDFIVMEYAEGETLKSMIDRNPIPVSQLIDIGAQLADGLAAAHSAGFIHRDIKPSNILVTPQGQPKILDFGLAKVIQVGDEDLSHEDTLSRLTRTGMILGTIAYMSPEQTRGEVLDNRTDIFSLGCVLYEAVTGKVPFSGPSILSVMHEIATAEPPAPSGIIPSLPEGLDRILKRAMAKDKDQRYSSCAEMAIALRGLRFANRYQIVRELGRGGMGVVYLAQDPLLEREVAIKVVTPDFLTDEAIERFQREAKVVAKMDHPSIVGIYDIGENEGSLFFVMPYVTGTSLRAFLKDESISLGEVIDIGIQTAEALDYSHSKGVIHRDIKPENILVTREASGGVRVRVTDFGLAMASAHSHLTKTGTLVGTIAYLSPEQMTERDLDGRSDIFSLGIVLYECLVGRPPYSGELQSVLYRIAHEIPQPPRSVGADVPEELEKIVMRCLEKEPTKRPQSAREVVDALVRLRSQLRDSDRVQKLSIIHRGSVVAQRPVLSRLIGREKEFGELQRRLNQALQNECQFAVIGGEAGVGKSRLLDELENLARARKLRVLHSRFVEQEQAFPYQAFCEAIQDYFRLKITTGSGPIDLSDLAGDLVSLFPVLAEVDEISGKHKPAPLGEAKKIQDRTYIYDLLARSFIRIGAGKPIVLFFEDLHNADVSLDALQYVVRRLGATPTLIVGTYRSTEVDKNHPLVRMLKSFQGDRRFAQLQLEPFTLDEHRAFLQTLIGSEDLEEGFVEKLYEATEGNPHFIRELVRSLIDSERIVKTDTGVWNLSGETALSSDVLPPTIQETVEKRIERLPQEWKEILSIASIPGRTFEFHDLEMLSGSKDLDDIVDGLISAGFVEEQRGSRGDVLTFSSGIVRDVLYAELPRRRRRTLHRKYAEELEKRFAGRLESVYPLLLHHYSEGDVPEKVIHFGVEQIKKSLDAFSTEDALRAAKTVLEFLHAESSVATELEGNVRMLIASAYRMGGNIDSALRELESAIRIFEQHASHAEVLAAVVATAETAWEGRRIEETREWVQVGIDLAHKSSASNEILGQLLSLGATVANLRGEYDLAKGYLEEAERLKPVEKQAQETVIKGGSLTVALPNAVAASIPVNLNTTEEAEILSVVFETLLGMDEQGHLIPSLSEEWKVLEEGKCFSFRLRSPVTLHDGQLLTAAKAKAALEKAIRTGRDRLAAALAAIRGVSDFLNGASDEVAGIIVESEQELRIELEEPLPIYPGLLTDPRASIVFPADSKLPVGTGPFRMKSFEPNRVILERNDAHWKEPPHLDALQFRCGVASAEIAAGLKSGELDLGGNLLSDDLEEILQDRWRRPTLVEVPKKNVYFILFNTKSPYFRTEEVRIALGGTLRVHDLVRSTLGRFAQPAEGFLPPGILGHDPGRRRQPLPDAKVKGLLEESGLQLPLGLKAAVHPLFQDRYAALTNAVLKVWANFQVQFTSETPNMTTFLDSWVKNAGQFDLLIGRWNADYDDPDNFMYVLFDSELGEFRQYFSSPEFDRMIEEARIENSPAVREKMYRKLESYLIEKGYVIPLFHEIDYRVATPSVRGLTLSSRAPFVNYPKIWKSQGPSVSTARKTGGGVIHVPMSAMTNDLNPATAVSRATIESIWNIFDTLTRQVEGARIVPWLASSFHAEEGGRWYRFRLRDDIRFHDGRRLTARDVRYTFERLFLTEDSIRGMYFCIRGSQDLAAGKTKELEGFRIHSAHEFTIELEERLSFFPALLANAASCIVPEGLKELKGTWRDGFVGTGAFRVIRWEPGKRLELEANPNYWRPGYPKCEGIVFHYNVPPKEIYSGFRSGKYSLASDLILSDAENLRHDPEFASGYKEIPFLSTYFIVLNSRKGPLSDLQMRQSLIDKIDVAGLTRKHTGRLGLPAHSLIPPGLLGYEKRRKLGGKEAPGQPKSLSGLNLHLVLHSVYRGPYSELAEDMVRSFEEKGVSCDVGQEVVEQLIAQGEFHSASPDIVFIRWFNDYPDADSFYHTLLHSKKGVLGFLCGSPELDRLIERGRMETDPNVRHQIYQEAEQLIARQTLLLPLFHEQTYRIARPEVQDLQLLISADTVAYEKLYVSR